MELTSNRNTTRRSGSLAAWKRSVLAMSVAAVIACIGTPAGAQPGLCTTNNANDASGTGVACGDGAKAAKAGAIAVGYQATANGDDAIAVGNKAQAQADGSLALGAGSTVTAGAVGSIALGTGSVATTSGEFSIGDVGKNLFRRITGVADGTSPHDAATVGQLVTATQQNHAVKYDWQDLDGDGIADANEVNYNKVTMGGATYDDATGVGGTTITNVANGVNPSDAVNKKQLDQLADTPITFAGNTGSVETKLGGTLLIQGQGTTGAFSGANLKTEVGSDGVLQILMAESPKFGSVVINDGGSGKITGLAVGTADTDAVNVSQLNEVKDTANAGWNLSAAGDATTATNVGPREAVDLGSTDGNLVVRKTAASNDVTFDLAKDITVDSVTMGGTVVNADGLMITDGPSITVNGIDAGSRVITRVADGVDSTDAVNKGQLDDLAGKPLTFAGNTGSVETKLGGTLFIQGQGTTGTFSGTNLKTEVDAAGVLQIQMAESPKFGSVVINDGGSGKITGVTAGTADNDAVNVLQLKGIQDIANAGWKLSAQADATTMTSVGPGETVDLSNTDGNLVVEKTAASDDVTFDLAKDITVDSVTMGDTVVNTAGLTIANGPSITINGIDAGGKAITSVAAGSVTDTSTEAINGSQLFATNKAIEDLGSVAGNANDLAVKYGWSDTNGDGIATSDEIDYGTVTLAGANGAGTRIDNVAPGLLDLGSMQAINGSQLFQSMSQVAAMLGGGATMTSQGLTAPSYFIQNTTYSDVGSALQALDIAVTRIDGRPVIGGSDLVGYTHGVEGGYTPSGNGGSSSTALGVNAHATGVEDAVAVGESATVGAAYGTALGQNASVTAEGAVALGHNSVADRADTVSVGSAGAERQVVNVADATQGTDAINKRQLDRGVASANSYTDARVNALSDSFDLFQGAVDERLRRQDRRIDRQGAMNAAMMNMAMSAAGIHTENRVGVGIGFQGGQSAMSLGYQRALSERATITFGGAFSSDDSSVGLGAGFGW